MTALLFDFFGTLVRYSASRTEQGYHASHGLEPPDAIFIGDTDAADYAGPRAAGMRALLIDPAGTADIPDEDRLHSIIDTRHRVGSGR